MKESIIKDSAYLAGCMLMTPAFLFLAVCAVLALIAVAVAKLQGVHFFHEEAK